MTPLRSIAASAVLAGALLLSALVPAPLASRAGSLAGGVPGARFVGFSDEPACEDGQAAEAAPVEPGTAVESHGIVIELAASDHEAGSGALTATVRHRDGEPVAEALVFFTIRMPAMDHGESAYPAREEAAGEYRADEVSLGMAGEWVVTVEVIRQARAPAVATYRVEVAEG